MKYFDGMRFPLLSTAIVVALAAGMPSAQAQVRIIGGLSNFDVPNDGEDECNEFDIEFEGPHVEDVYHTYHNGNYGSPVITALPGNIGIRVVYSRPRHATAPPPPTTPRSNRVPARAVSSWRPVWAAPVASRQRKISASPSSARHRSPHFAPAGKTFTRVPTPSIVIQCPPIAAGVSFTFGPVRFGA